MKLINSFYTVRLQYDTVYLRNEKYTDFKIDCEHKRKEENKKLLNKYFNEKHRDK
jgi:hypothetical protein